MLESIFDGRNKIPKGGATMADLLTGNVDEATRRMLIK